MRQRQRALARLVDIDVDLAVVERYEHDDDGPDYNCGDRCDFCVPDWRDRDEALRQLDRDRPSFTLADRLLAQVGIVLVQVPA